MKRFISCLLLVAIILSNYSVCNAKTYNVKCNIKIGRFKTIDLSKYGIKKNDKIVSTIDYPDDSEDTNSKYNIDSYNVTKQGTKLLFRPKSSGRIDFTFVFKSGKRIRLTGSSYGSLVSSEKYNKLTDVIGIHKTKSYEYDNVLLSYVFNDNGDLKGYCIEAYKIYNLTNDVISPDFKISFFDKNKKKICTQRLSKLNYEEITEEIQPNDYTRYFITLIIKGKNARRAKYWRIENV